MAPSPGRASPADARLLCDAMLGSLATHLRMCGYDAAYAPDRGVEADEAILAIAREEGRTVLTRDRELAARAPDSVLLRSLDVDDQLRELREAGFVLALSEPARCANCNGRLRRVGEDEGGDGDDGGSAGTPEYAPDPADRPVWRCPDCGQCFWRGSHWDDVARRLDAL